MSSKPMPNNPTTASPARSKEVDYGDAVQLLQQSWHDNESVKLHPRHIKALLTHLEASQPKPQSDEGLREGLEAAVKALDLIIERTDQKSIRSIANGVYGVKARAALSRQAPVPTSGAVEGVYGILADIRECIDFDGHDLDEKQAAAIIQQYGAAREVEGRRDQEQFHLEEMAAQPPAADGKLK